MTRHTPVDTLFGVMDQMLRTVFGPAPRTRPSPADSAAPAELSPAERDLSGRLMRINHAGEMCAQALYQGQALTARDSVVRTKLEQAAREEFDHLAWTEERVRALGTHTSLLNPLWYLGSFGLGAIAGALGDRVNLGFLAETERQVVRHLAGHLDRLPEKDDPSRKILEQMRDDEGRHATVAIEGGGMELPRPVKEAMRLASKVMTGTAYWV